jgi:hypothetical protein
LQHHSLSRKAGVMIGIRKEDSLSAAWIAVSHAAP